MSDDGKNEGNEPESADEGHYVVRCRGLPWSTTVDEIKNFFNNCQFKEGKIDYILNQDKLIFF